MASSSFVGDRPLTGFNIYIGWTYTCVGCGTSAPIRLNKRPELHLCKARTRGKKCRVINHTTRVHLYRHWSDK